MTVEENFKQLQDFAFVLDEKMPLRVWVEGDGKMYGDFQSNTGTRTLLTPYDAIKLIHTAGHTARQMISV